MECEWIIITIFAPMNENNWSENIIIADADHIDKVAFNLIVNFERMLGRRIPQADLSKWAECVALDGGVRERKQTAADEQQTHVVLIYNKQQQQLKNFVPSGYEKELNGQAFKSNLGEFVISALPVEELTNKDDFFIETLEMVGTQKDVKRLMVIPSDSLYNRVAQTLRQIDNTDQHITLFSMEPRPSGQYRQEILGYSLMAALGISGDEIEGKMR